MSTVALVVIGILLTLNCFSLMRSFMADRKANDHGLSIWHKGCASLCFVGLAVTAAIHCRYWDYAWKLILAQTFGLIGDELLAMRYIQREKHDQWFTMGGVSFAIGHALLIWAIWQRSGSSIATSANIIFVLMLILSGLYGGVKDVQNRVLRISAILYLALVCYMGGSACGAAIDDCSVSTLLMAAGGLAFVISDNGLVNYAFGKKASLELDWLIHASYYTAQLCIAWSIFFAK
jgi:uncharacterized membrane protein